MNALSYADHDQALQSVPSEAAMFERAPIGRRLSAARGLVLGVAISLSVWVVGGIGLAMALLG